MQYVLEIEDLCKHYADFSLQNVTIKVAPGNVVGLIGSNGAGKTTTLKAALGMISIDSGKIFALGHAIEASKSLTDSTKSRIGVVLDSCAFPADYRVKDVDALGKAAYTTWNQRKWSCLIERFDLPASKKVEGLSRGMGMKLSLAFALSHDPDLLILDEATAGLDPMAREEVLDLLREFMLDETHSILISSHITTDLEKIADEIVCLDAGKVVFSVEKDKITDEAGIVRLRATEIDEIIESAMLSAVLSGRAIRILQHDNRVDMLVPDRFAFAKAFPDAIVDKASIEEYMALTLKGETR